MNFPITQITILHFINLGGNKLSWCVSNLETPYEFMVVLNLVERECVGHKLNLLVIKNP